LNGGLCDGDIVGFLVDFLLDSFSVIIERFFSDFGGARGFSDSFFEIYSEI